jgi:cAMP phosphodiesterase
MELRILGCHGGESPRHKTSSFLIDRRVAVDAGATTSTLTLAEQHAIETVLVSHAHLDHVRDLATLADNRCQQGGPTLVVAGLPETLAVLRAHFFNNLLWPDFTKIPAGPSGAPTLELREIRPGQPVELSGMRVEAVTVDHTIDAAGFVIQTGSGTLGYSGDTGPTDELWRVLGAAPDLRGVLVEVSFPNHRHALAKVSGHHTPETLAADLAKLERSSGRAGATPTTPILVYHIKPIFEAEVERELALLSSFNLGLCRLDDRYML